MLKCSIDASTRKCATQRSAFMKQETVTSASGRHGDDCVLRFRRCCQRSFGDTAEFSAARQFLLNIRSGMRVT